jgi:cytochrome c oxidase cbb3-type subunit 3
MDAMGRTITAAVAAAIVAGGSTAWVMGTRASGRGHQLDISSTAPLPPEGPAARVPLGDIAGSAETRLPDDLPNPLESDASATAEGHRLYDKMNCAGCHGYTAKGGMGPDLTDGHWRYGGTPVQIYKSVYEGRPQGMPAWGRALPQKSIWQITRYIESLGGSFPAGQYHAGLQGDLADKGGNTSSSKSLARSAGGDSGEGGSHDNQHGQASTSPGTKT